MLEEQAGYRRDRCSKHGGRDLASFWLLCGSYLAFDYQRLCAKAWLFLHTAQKHGFRNLSPGVRCPKHDSRDMFSVNFTCGACSQGSYLHYIKSRPSILAFVTPSRHDLRQPPSMETSMVVIIEFIIV